MLQRVGEILEGMVKTVKSLFVFRARSCLRLFERGSSSSVSKMAKVYSVEALQHYHSRLERYRAARKLRDQTKRAQLRELFPRLLRRKRPHQVNTLDDYKRDTLLPMGGAGSPLGASLPPGTAEPRD